MTLPFTKQEKVWAAKAVTETVTLDTEFSLCMTKVIEIATTGFTGTLDIKGKESDLGTFDNVAYFRMGQDGIQSLINNQLEFVGDTGRYYYCVPEHWHRMQLVMTRSAGTISVDVSGHESSAVAPWSDSAKAEWKFGEPVLEAGGKGKAKWTDTSRLEIYGAAVSGQGSTGPWAVRLDAGPQSSWDDFAKVAIPVNELPFLDLDSVRLHAYYSEASGIDMGVCVYLHDPEDFDQVVEISHTPATTSAAGWRELNYPTDVPTGHAFFWYGNVTDTPDTCPTEGTAYTWAQFQADSVFSGWTVFKITLDYGYHTGGELMNGCFLTQALINGETIRLEPSVKEQLDLMRDNVAAAQRIIPTWKFGQPEIRCDNRGWGKWERVARNAKYIMGADANRQFRHGEWAIHLNGGAQASGEDWASIWIPVNDIPLKDFTEFAFNYYRFLDGTADSGYRPPNFVITTRNPDDHDERADITQDIAWGGTMTEGWHENTLAPTTTAKLFWYGNNVTSDITEGVATLSTLAAYQADKAFAHHVVYMIKIDFGYWGGTLSTGDAWIGGIRINGKLIPLVPDETQKAEVVEFEKSIFGAPELRYNKNSRAYWSRGSADPRYHASGTGWQACLHGRAQTGDDWAACYIPINELPVPLFNTARWSYVMQSAQSMGVNMVIWVHDPYDHIKRAEITQLGSLVDRASGRNAHELNQTTDQFFYYGEGVANTSVITGAGPGTLFGWDDFQADECFNTWTIYRISFEMGWEASGTFDHAWLVDLVLNNQQIPLKPRTDADLAPIHDYSETTAATFTFTVAPKTPFQLLSLDLHAGAGLAGTALTITKDAGADGSTNQAWFDTIVYSFDIVTAASTSHRKTFEGPANFSEDDELVVAQSNTGAQDIGCDVCWKPI